MDIKHKNIYTDLELLPIYNFEKCIKGDLTYLNIDRRELITDGLKEVWQELYNEYCKLTITSETERYYRLIGEITWLENRLKYAPVLFNLLIKTPREDRKELIKELKQWKLSISIKKDLEPQIETNITILNNSKTKLKRKITELEDLRTTNEQVKSIGTTLQQQAIKIYKLLGVKPDILKDSVIMWLGYWEEIKQSKQTKNG
ncbi:hypothetical protein [Tenacibaculum phage JQ]|nr:hypothetical protein [Tenacibaculum phage JQ]